MTWNESRVFSFYLLSDNFTILFTVVWLFRHRADQEIIIHKRRLAKQLNINIKIKPRNFIYQNNPKNAQKKRPEKKYKSIRAGLVDLPLPLQGLRTQNKKISEINGREKMPKKDLRKKISRYPSRPHWSACASAGAQDSFPLQHFLNW